ncbi:hypothetical protein EJ110_NYTH51413 [Nymphaea thermarum]|nr:hypothetical protein EJ110_NYTH51413 [Nymphaea thermarum]
MDIVHYYVNAISIYSIASPSSSWQDERISTWSPDSGRLPFHQERSGTDNPSSQGTGGCSERTQASSAGDTHHLSGRRKAAALCCLVAFLASGYPSRAALALGTSGLKEWLKEQKRKASKYVLAPIDASRQRLRTAYDLLKSSPDNSSNVVEETKRLVNVAARDCVPQDRNSFVAFQASTGVEVCTFRLIVKNASSLLDAKDPVKLEAEALLGSLIRSFVLLGDVLDATDLASDREKVEGRLIDAIAALDNFEQGIKNCLDV